MITGIGYMEDNEERWMGIFMGLSEVEMILFMSEEFDMNLKIWEDVPGRCISIYLSTYRRLRARRTPTMFNDVLLRTRRALLPQTLYSNSALLDLNGTSL